MTVIQAHEDSESEIRSSRPGDESILLDLLRQCFGSFEYRPRLKQEISGEYLDRKGSFIAEKNGTAIGCVGLRKFPHERWFEIRYLAVNEHSKVHLAETLVDKTIQYADSNHVEQLKAFVPAIQPFVDVYKKAGFKPARRSLRISWDLTRQPTAMRETGIQTRRLSKEHANDAAEVWVEGLRPYWDYWIEEQGGPDEIKTWVRGSVGTDPWWTGAFLDEKLVGLSILRPDAYGPGEARFNGAYVLPKFRGRKVGSVIMNATIREAQSQNQKKMNVYTVAFTDHLAPGSLLYLKSGGKIEAEYLQLERGK